MRGRTYPRSRGQLGWAWAPFLPRCLSLCVYARWAPLGEGGEEPKGSTQWDLQPTVTGELLGGGAGQEAFWFPPLPQEGFRA